MISKKIMVLLLSIVAISSIGACSAIVQPFSLELNTYDQGFYNHITVIPAGTPDPGDYVILTLEYQSGDTEISRNVPFLPVEDGATSWNFYPKEEGEAILNVAAFSADGTEYASVDTTLMIDPIDD